MNAEARAAPHPLLLKQITAADVAFKRHLRAALIDQEKAKDDPRQNLRSDKHLGASTPEVIPAGKQEDGGAACAAEVITPQEQINAAVELHSSNRLIQLNIAIATAIDLSEHHAGLHFMFGGEVFDVIHSSTSGEAGDQLDAWARGAPGRPPALDRVLVIIRRRGWSTLSVSMVLDPGEHSTLQIAPLLARIRKVLGMPVEWFGARA